MVSSAVYVVIPISIAAVIVLRKLIAGDWKLYSTDICMKGKTVIITGANSGVGFETAKALVKRDATVIFACRNMDRARNAVNKIRAKESGGELIPIQLDLASFESIENFVKIVQADFDKIDVLINNAGVVVRLEFNRKTEEGFEMNFGGADTGVFLATDPSIIVHSGGYYCDCKEYTATYPYKKEDEEKLWQISQEMVKARKPI